MTWANVDDLFPEHPKVLRAGGDAGWLYICGLCFTNRNLTEGRIPKVMVPRLSDRKNPTQLAKVLVDVGLWHDKGDHYVIHDWEKYNEDADTVKARKEQARKAAQARWAGKPKGAPSSADSNAGSNAGSIAPSMQSADAQPADEQCPPTPLVLQTSSSSNHLGGGMAEIEEEEPDFEAKACAIVAQRLHDKLTEPIPAGLRRDRWLAKTAADLRHRRKRLLADLAATGASVENMVDILDPRPAVAPPPSREQLPPAWDLDDNGMAVPRAVQA